MENVRLSKRKRHFFIGECCFFSTSRLMCSADALASALARRWMQEQMAEMIFTIQKIALLRRNIFSQYKILKTTIQNILNKPLILNNKK